jgi:hypothetical protein
VRLIQSFWYQNDRNPSPSLIDSVVAESRKSQAEYFLLKMQDSVLFRHREELWSFAVSQLENPEPTLLEFGVFEGHSLNYLGKLLPKAQIYGFDSFEGLQENWTGTNLVKGSLDLEGKMPSVPKNTTLVKGWFEETLPVWLTTVSNDYIDLLHIDSDTYTPASYVLNSLNHKLRSGTIVVFDEYFGYPGWKSHEFRAWQEFVNRFSVSYLYIGVAEQSVAIKILKIDS